MTNRPVYLPKLTRPFYKIENFSFDWNPGQSIAQKQKNSQILRGLYKEKYPQGKILEASTKSDTEEGKSLSPFNLTLRLPSLRKAFPVENIFHASKAFRHGGPYVDLLGVSPTAAKNDPRLLDSGEIVHFVMEGKKYPAEPDYLFYNWLYLRALLANPQQAASVKNADAFCDIEYNPSKGKNNQARACAIFHSLSELGLLEKAKDFEGFKSIMMALDNTEIKEQSGRTEGAQNLNELRSPKKRTSFSVGDWLFHPSIGTGQVMRKSPGSYLIKFRVTGPRQLTADYVELNCKKVPAPLG